MYASVKNLAIMETIRLNSSNVRHPRCVLLTYLTRTKVKYIKLVWSCTENGGK